MGKKREGVSIPEKTRAVDPAVQDLLGQFRGPFKRYQMLRTDLESVFGRRLEALTRDTSSAIERRIPHPAYWSPGIAYAFHWIVPYGTTSVDPRLLEIFRQRQPLDVRIPLVVEYAVPTPDEFNEQGSVDEAMDDFAWTLERHWAVEWDGVLPERRPGLVLTRPDGTVVLGSGLPPRLREGLMALSTRWNVRADALRQDLAWRTGEKPTSADLSRALATLRAQGLIHLADESIAWSARRVDRVRPDRRPYKIYLSVAHEVERQLWLGVRRGSLYHGQWIDQRAPSMQDGHIQEDRANRDRWFRLVDRLRQRGLRTV